MRALYDVPAPAKLNTFLHITGRRADGYHLLQSVFLLIDWQDRLHFELRADATIARHDLGSALPPDDLILRAARALQAATGCGLGADIHIEKSIPAQAGMGGGSSDAASTLLALNRLWNLGLSTQQLSRIGLTLGADVPFFLCGHNAWVEGIGELITPLHDAALAGQDIVVAKPQAGLDTKSIFSHPSLKRDSERATISVFADKHFDFGRNDLQPVAEGLCPEIKKTINWFESQGLHARMTGSGSAVFAVKRQDQSHTVGQAPDWIVRDCKSLAEHPLRGWSAD
ncbi:MAG: 4-(cytidine 5'-diphospho)-2-C-methyl-D-erythritol kinase [Comamonas sp.]